MLGDSPFVGFVPVTDLDAARRFYCDVLGLAAIEENPVALVVRSGPTTLRLTAVAAFDPQPFTVAGWVVDDAAGTSDALARSGVELRRFDGMEQDGRGLWTTPGGDQVAWFNDPDGNLLSITQPSR